MDLITAFFGRFHPLLVHLPIGILFIAFLFECLSVREKYRVLKSAVQPALFWGTFFAVASAITGYFLRQEGGYEERTANLHQNFGIATATLAFILYVLRPKVKYWMTDPARKRRVRILMFIPLILLLTVTGHWGGSLTHGEDYLFAAVSLNENETPDPAVRIQAISSIPDAILYKDVIQPIFEARCYDCHSSRKEKGDLRLDTEEFIRRGGKHGEVISDGPADSSSLYHRLMLPLEDEDHMPPNEKPQLSSSEIALIQYWIEEQAQFDKPIASFQSSQKITAIIESLKEAPRQSWIPKEPVNEAKEKSLQKLTALGLNPMRLAAENNYLMVTFTGFQELSDEQINSLLEIKDQLVWLNLNNTRVTDLQMEGVSKLGNLRVLYLNNTPVTDAGVSRLSVLPELRWLSLVGTRVTDQSIPVFQKFRHLANLFLYQTGVTQGGIRQVIESHEDLKVDTGNYMLKKLPTDTIVYKKISLND
ncbi:MAG: c-type cytochrome domain-containing protein [Chryseosolibacter sp.]